MFQLPSRTAIGMRFRDVKLNGRIPGLHAAIESVRHTGASTIVEDIQPPDAERPQRLAITIRPGIRRGQLRAVTLYVADTMALLRLHDEVGRLTSEHAVERTDLEAAQESLEATMEELSAMQTANETLVQADLRKNEFIAMLAHELRNPLSSAMTALDVVVAHPEDKAATDRALAVAHRQFRQLRRLLDDLLDVSRMTHSRIQLRKRVVDFRSILTEAVEATRHQFEAAGLRFSVWASGSDPLCVEADSTRLVQAIVNLLANAAKYTPRGGRVTMATKEAGDHVLVSVHDTGIGIQADMLERIFEMFEQAGDESGRRNEGLGIGLTLARRIVELHGGILTARSGGPHRGSTFVIRLPLMPVGLIPEPSSAPASPPPPRHVLIVDDNRDAREMLELLLRLDGHRVAVAASGATAVELATASRPEVALIDLGLPDITGYEVARRIRAALGETVRLVALTGYGLPKDRRQAQEAGFMAHIVKPADHETLHRILTV